MKKNTAATPTSSKRFVIIGSGGSAYTYATTTDISNGPFTYGNISTNYNNFVPRSICCGIYNSANLWVAIGISGTTLYSSTSTNGTTWTTRSSSISSIFGSSGWIFGALNFGYASNGTTGIFMATGYSGTSGNPQVAISLDGVTWKTGGTPFSGTGFGNDCFYGNGYWVVVGNSGANTTCAKYSTNVDYTDNTNISWTSVGTVINPCYSVRYNGSRWFYGCASNYVVCTSNNTPNSALTSSSNAGQQYVSALAVLSNDTFLSGGSGNGGSYVSRGVFSGTISFPFNQIIETNTSRSWQMIYDASSSLYAVSTQGSTSNQMSLFLYGMIGGIWTPFGKPAVGTNLINCVGIAQNAM